MIKNLMILFILLFIFFNAFSQSAAYDGNSFTNPLFPSGADPWIIQKDGVFYYCGSAGNSLFLRKARSLSELKLSEKKTIWTPPQGTSYSKELWAPEMHFVKGKWYIYFAADSGNNRSHRMHVLENISPDPLTGVWELKGKVSDLSDKWAIDGSVFEYSGVLYMIWSGWEGDVNGEQDIYIARMKNPWTIEGNRAKISVPTYEWERVGDLNNPNDVAHVNVNEGPVALIKKDKLFIIFSASGCWTDSYCLGMLTFNGKDNLLDPINWSKNPLPVFKQKPESGVYAPGHNSFFTSPDGKESWIVYHANAKPGQGCGGYRAPFAQKFFWRKDGTPDLGEPVNSNIPIANPSGSVFSK
jgi:GH43 family beta-xylosidase